MNNADLNAAIESVQLEIAGWGQGGCQERSETEVREIVKEKARLYKVSEIVLLGYFV